MAKFICYIVIITLFLITLITAISFTSPYEVFPYTPVVGNLSCNSRFNGSTDIDNYKVFMYFEISNTTHAVEINTCDSYYNTKITLYHWESENDRWNDLIVCDNCIRNPCYPNEQLVYNLQSLLNPGYYAIAMFGYQDLTGNFSIYLKCHDVTPLYVSKYGWDNKTCGLDMDSPCGTIYYTSTLIVNDYTEIIVLDGQNETGIISEHQCLPKIETDYIYFVYFTPSNIKSMSDWYPDKCRINKTNKYLFQHMKDLKFNNLIIDDYVFMDQGIISTESHMECHNCTFRNITIINTDGMDVIYVGLITIIHDSVFDSIFMPNAGDFINANSELQTFDRNIVQNIDIIGNFISVQV